MGLPEEAQDMSHVSITSKLHNKLEASVNPYFLKGSNLKGFGVKVNPSEVDPIVKTESLKNKVVFLKGSVFVFNLFQPFCWSPVGDASPSLPLSGPAVSIWAVKAARHEHPKGLALTAQMLTAIGTRWSGCLSQLLCR